MSSCVVSLKTFPGLHIMVLTLFRGITYRRFVDTTIDDKTKHKLLINQLNPDNSLGFP